MLRSRGNRLPSRLPPLSRPRRSIAGCACCRRLSLYRTRSLSFTHSRRPASRTSPILSSFLVIREEENLQDKRRTRFPSRRFSRSLDRLYHPANFIFSLSPSPRFLLPRYRCRRRQSPATDTRRRARTHAHTGARRAKRIVPAREPRLFFERDSSPISFRSSVIN